MLKVATLAAIKPLEVLVNTVAGSITAFNCKKAGAAGLLRRSIFWPAPVLMLVRASSWMLAPGLMNKLPVPAWAVVLMARGVPKRSDPALEPMEPATGLTYTPPEKVLPLPLKNNWAAPVLMIPSPAPESVTLAKVPLLVMLKVGRFVRVTLLNIGVSLLLPVSVSVWPPIMRLLKATILPVPVPLLRFTVTVALPFTTMLLVLKVKVLPLLLVATSST